LPEKKRARRRLIGAVALVLAVVIVLPMVLDSEPRPLADDIAIQIPSKDGKDAVKDATADAKPAAPEAQSQAQPKEEFVDPKTLAPVAEQPAIAPSAPLASVDAKPKPEAPAAAAKADSKPAPKPAEHKDDRKKDVKEAVKPKAADKPDDAARALAILEGKPAAADKKPAAGGKFVIQVAALATQEKVDELRGKLSGAGIKSYTQKVATQSGERTRIRVGPFASRDEADKTRARIIKLGLPATVVPA
jgi:DedD protein